jgi:hypothetical protein
MTQIVRFSSESHEGKIVLAFVCKCEEVMRDTFTEEEQEKLSVSPVQLIGTGIGLLLVKFLIEYSDKDEELESFERIMETSRMNFNQLLEKKKMENKS